MFKFRKVASILASTLMVASTVGLAAAANYPAPYVQGGTSNVAVVYGGPGIALTDVVAASDIKADLVDRLLSQRTTPDEGDTVTVEGEAYELFTSSSPLLLNSTLNSVRQTVTSTQLPTVLADGTFETTTNTDYTQRLELGSTPILEFKAQPTSDDDPQLGFSMSTTPSSSPTYNATVTFDANVNFSTSDSEGETIELFGKQYTVSAATTATKLILMKSSQTLDLSSDGEMSAEVEVDGKTYTVELLAATDADARIKVTDDAGVSDTKTIVEENSKTIRGLEVGLTYANEDTARNLIQASLTLGSSRVVLQDGSAVKYGTDEKTIDGTNVEFYLANGTGTSNTNLGKIVVQVSAADSDTDAIVVGGAFSDPVFGSFKIDFPTVTAPLDDDSARDVFDIKNSGSDKMTVNFLSHDGTEAKTIYWAYNKTTTQNGNAMDLADNNGYRIVPVERATVNKSEFTVFSNTYEGGLYEVTTIYNASDGYTDDYISLKNVMTGDEKDYKATAEGEVTGVSLQGKTYDINYYGSSTSDTATRYIRVNSGESTGANIIVYPTIATPKGAKIAFYEPASIDLSNIDGAGTDATGIKFDDGDGYGDYPTLVTNGAGATTWWNVTTASGATTSINTTLGGSAKVTVGKLSYNITFAAGSGNTTVVYLNNPQDGSYVTKPALIIWEPKDASSEYQAMVVTLDAGYDGSNAGIGVQDVVRTWSADSLNDEVQLETNEDLYQEMDIYGSLATLDKADSDQTTAKVSVPEEQLTAYVYAAEESAAISGGSSGGQGSGEAGNIVMVVDSEVSSVSGKNLIVVGGSCINTVAAQLLGSSTPLCGADFTAATGVGAGQFMIQTFERTGGTVATLVAGYNAGDTVNGAKYLTTQTVDTTAGKKYIGSSATSAELVEAEGGAGGDTGNTSA